MKNTILFDLDGTLLPMDFDKFMKLYFYHLSEYLKEDVDPNDLPNYIWESTKKMVMTNDGRSNEAIFMEHFSTYVDKDITYYYNKFLDFYNTDFSNIKASTYQSEDIQKSISLLKEKGYTLVIATNPLFPLTANYHRITWAGLDPNDFDHITSFEENTFCKPFPQFYSEVLKRIQKTPEDCYMVGNDVEEDLAAKHIGIETYLITDCIVNQKNLENTSDHTGTYKDFLQFVECLPVVKQ